MKHIIIGTAGHIDHGKTTLIKALTGRETDTLKEEKSRGISINLGFTFFDLPSGKRAGIIDVPGHEKFVKNMLAGVSGIDIVMLVIAADEGIMPQTKEHLEILQLLNIKNGAVVLTKKDMVDDEWLEMIKEEVREKIQGTFLENSPILPVSSRTGEGMDKVMEYLDKASEEVEAKDTIGHFRMPVDRVFSISGFGTVVTGTIYGGRVTIGDIIEIYPQRIKGKIRNVQVHDKDVNFAEAGQRCALNISGIKTEEISRGDVIAKEGILEPSLMIDCSMYYLKSADKPLINRQRVRLYHGTDEIFCRVVILDREEINPGESAYVQLRLEKPISAQRNDRYVIRSYSPMVTIGGGAIIEPVARKAKRLNKEYIEELKIKESGSVNSIIESTVDKLSKDYPGNNEILKALGKNEEKLPEILENLVQEKKIICLQSGDKNIYIHNKFFMKKLEETEALLKEFHKNNPLKPGISKEEFKNKIFTKSLKQKNYDELLKLLIEENLIKITGNSIALDSFQVVYSKEQQEIKNYILKEYTEGAYAPPKVEDLSSKVKNKKEFKAVLESLIEQGELYKVSEDCILKSDYFIKAKEDLIEFIEKNGAVTAGEFRDMLNTSRKYAVAILEHLDSLKITKRVEDTRVLA